MNGFTQVTIEEPFIIVNTGNNILQFKLASANGISLYSKECCVRRKVRYPIGAEWCPCLACEITKVLIKEGYLEE